MLKQLGRCDTVTEARKKIVEMLDAVSVQLGNTRAVCRKYYVHPLITGLYEQGKLDRYFIPEEPEAGIGAALKPEELLLMKILEAESATVILP